MGHIRADCKDFSIASISSELKGESDRASAIVGRGLVEEQLKQLLASAMIQDREQEELFKGYAPLATLSARSKIAYYLGLVSKDVYNDINLIRKIGNEFAHHHEGLSFSKSPVTDWANNLNCVQWFLAHLEYANKPPSKDEVADINNNPRRRFEIGVAIISITLDKYKQSIEPREPPDREYEWVQSGKGGCLTRPPHTT